MAAPAYLRHDSSLRHDTDEHPERTARIAAIEAAMEAHGWLGFERIEAPAVERPVLEAVHPAPYVDAIASFCADGGGMLDADTVACPESYEAACRSAGAAAHLVDLLLGGVAPSGFCGLRPPGHHAGAARAMGFCVFNNVAVAARRALDEHAAERVLIVDWDVHHGNGTNDIFHASREVLFVSIHQSPLYPGTGAASDVGGGEGIGHTVNLPVPAGSGDETFGSLVEHVVAPLARAHEPRLVLLSAGYDAHRDDPLAGCRVTEEGYATMAGSLRRVCAEIEAPLGVVLEGGYDLRALAASVAATLAVVGADDPPAASPLAVHPLARAARERLAEHWPGLPALSAA